MKRMLITVAGVLTVGFAGAMYGQSHGGHGTTDHNAHAGHTERADHAAHNGPPMPHETGQSAFAAIAEIVALLQSSPETEWDKVDIDALRLHLVDMDTVTLRSDVATTIVDGGAVFDVTSREGSTTASIQRMLLAHSKTMTGKNGLNMQAAEIAGGARLTVTGENPAMIRGLGFFGVMTLGMHHQAHHLALASGSDPHH